MSSMRSLSPTPARDGRRARRGVFPLLLPLALLAWPALAAGDDALPAEAGPVAREHADESSSPEDRLRQLEREVERLRALLDKLRAAGGDLAAEDRIAEIERRLGILAEEIERLQLGDAAARADAPQHGLGPAASKVYRTERGVSIGGYGELLYENYASRRDDGSASGRTDQIDLLRAVLYFGYKFSDRWLLNSEIEYEHATTGEGGEVSVEFAYLDYRRGPALNARAGLLLVPVGFLNEMHEPTVFLGARRPETERSILPTTWRENGAGVWGETERFSYRAYLTNGLDAEGFAAGGLRDGRQSGSRAKAEDVAVTGRFDYVGTPDLLAGVSVWHGGSGQGLEDSSGRDVDATVTLVDAHVEWRRRGFELRALAVRGEVDDAARLNDALGLAGSDSVGERLEGGYLQAGYDVFAGGSHGGQSLTPFARIERLDTQARVPSGFTRDPANDREILTVGVAWKPLDQVVLKADWQDFDDEAGTGTDQLNVLLGYVF